MSDMQPILDAIATQLAATAQSFRDQDKGLEFFPAVELARRFRVGQQLCDPNSAQTSATFTPNETFI